MPALYTEQHNILQDKQFSWLHVTAEHTGNADKLQQLKHHVNKEAKWEVSLGGSWMIYSEVSSLNNQSRLITASFHPEHPQMTHILLISRLSYECQVKSALLTRFYLQVQFIFRLIWLFYPLLPFSSNQQCSRTFITTCFILRGFSENEPY